MRPMDKNTGQTEAKLQALGAAPAEAKKDPNAAAKKAFEAAVEKTKATQIREGEIIETPKKAKQPKVEEVAERPEPKPQPNPELLALKGELAELRKQLQAKPEPKPEPKVEPKAKDFDVVQAELSEQFGEDEGKILTGALRALLEPREHRISQLENLIQKAVEQ